MGDFATTIQVIAVTLGMAEQILVKLQQFNGISWMNVSAEVAAVPINNGIGEYFIFLDEGLCAEAAVLPLMNRIRLVATTGATSTVTIGAVYMYRNEN